MAPERFSARLAGALIASGVILSVVPSATAAPAGGGALGNAPPPATTGGERIQYRNGTCAELRRACLYKRELGETGQGNCSRYRAECSGRSGYSSSYSRYRSYRAYRPWRYYD